MNSRSWTNDITDLLIVHFSNWIGKWSCKNFQRIFVIFLQLFVYFYQQVLSINSLIIICTCSIHNRFSFGNPFFTSYGAFHFCTNIFTIFIFDQICNHYMIGNTGSMSSCSNCQWDIHPCIIVGTIVVNYSAWKIQTIFCFKNIGIFLAKTRLEITKSMYSI